MIKYIKNKFYHYNTLTTAFMYTALLTIKERYNVMKKNHKVSNKRAEKNNKKRIKQVKKLVSNKAGMVSREMMKYTYDKKTSKILCQFTNFVNKVFTFAINKVDVLNLLPLAKQESNEQFYAYCNKNIHLLDTLHCSSKFKDKTGSNKDGCINTQYDSRKKLKAMIVHLAITELKQKAKAKGKTRKAEKVA